MRTELKLRSVWSRGRGVKGEHTGSTRPCQLEGCRGVRVGVRWPGGRMTWPCSKGMRFSPGGSSAEIL